MEDVLDVYARPYDPRFPVICMDEASKQLVGEVRDPLPVRPGDPLRIDSEYVRLGTCNLFMFCEPLRGWRYVRVTDRRTKVDWAYALRDFLQEFYTEAEKIVLVMDNLNTHSPGSFYEAAVRWAFAEGITGGTTATTFSPNLAIDRGQLVTLLYRYYGSPAVSGTESFIDVNPGDFFYAAVLWAVENGVTLGTGPDTFSPFQVADRAQAVTFLRRANGPTCS